MSRSGKADDSLSKWAFEFTLTRAYNTIATTQRKLDQIEREEPDDMGERFSALSESLVQACRDVVQIRDTAGKRFGHEFARDLLVEVMRCHE